MADDIGAREMPERDAAHAGQHARGLDQAALLAARQIGLRDIPVTTALVPKPMRVRNIFICSGVVFCASSRMMNEWLSVRPRMYASGANSIVVCSKSFAALSKPMRSYSAS